MHAMPRPTPRLQGPCCAALLALAAAWAPAAFAGSARYELDPVHTRVVFAISHAGYSQAIGTVSGSTGTLEFDPDDLAGARLEASVPLARLELGDAKWNRAALAGNLLDGGKHPLATFVSHRVEPVDDRHAAVFGTLTLHGVAREVKLDVTVNKVKRYPLPPFRRTAGFSATTTISRKAFGITAWPTLIGDSVELRIEAEATRTRAGAAQADDDDNEETAPAQAPAVVDPEAAIPDPAAADAPPPPATTPEPNEPRDDRP
jgi:polyisoprenoid-binding protein YceI